MPPRVNLCHEPATGALHEPPQRGFDHTIRCVRQPEQNMIKRTRPADWRRAAQSAPRAQPESKGGVPVTPGGADG